MASHQHHLFFLALFVTLVVTSTSINLIVGKRIPGNHLIDNVSVEQEAIWRKWPVPIVSVLRNFMGDGHSKITQIRSFDRDAYGNDGSAKIVSGGIGQFYVDMWFVSTSINGVNFQVEIYGMSYG